ncbi:hypothetical protein KOW79_010045 [Hemibagrus wyckioides]|uniref:Uncharacterized protein n=1 Tax=Hemibagrus wyckioides TaxID=337641 RepID=A0A9D3SP93_9TELE|nr:hypothetical protein KOW79_010045 [Hemibagrus wyckioides]
MRDDKYAPYSAGSAVLLLFASFRSRCEKSRLHRSKGEQLSEQTRLVEAEKLNHHVEWFKIWTTRGDALLWGPTRGDV